MLQQPAAAFNSDGVKALLRGHCMREDVLEAVLSVHGSGFAAHTMGEAGAAADLANVFRWAGSLERLLAAGEGMVLLAGFRRAGDLLGMAEKDGPHHGLERPKPGLYHSKEERELAVALALARGQAVAALKAEDYDLAMRAVASLRPFIQAFFNKIALQPALADLRGNRLRLLRELRMVLGLVGDLTKLGCDPVMM